MARIEISVPDIGNYSDIPVLELLVKPGDTVKIDQGLVTLESDKATMEVPSSAAGVVKELRVKVGDAVSQGTVVAVLESEEAGGVKAAATSAAANAGPSAPAGPSPAPAGHPLPGGEGKNASAATTSKDAAMSPPSPSGRGAGGEGTAEAKHTSPASTAAPATGRKPDLEVGVVVLGAGPGGYTAAFRAADLGLDVLLVERYPDLGGVCLNVGCIPSKALLHAARVIDEAAHAADYGVSYGAPKIDLDKLRGYKDKVVKQLTGGLAGMSKQRKVQRLTGAGTFVSPHELEVDGPDGKKLVRFAHAIIAAGSQAVKLPGLPWDDKRLMDSTDALDLADIPK
jgi:dihydrolipoamide dehydrogenase